MANIFSQQTSIDLNEEESNKKNIQHGMLVFHSPKLFVEHYIQKTIVLFGLEFVFVDELNEICW